MSVVKTLEMKQSGRKKISWWWLGIAVFFIGISLIEIKVLDPKEISRFERIFWWVCLIFWAFAGSLIIITKVRKGQTKKD